MNSFEFQYEFQKLLETVDSDYTVSEKLDTDTIFMILNISYLRYINEKYINKATAIENIEYLQKEAADLRGLIKRAAINPAAIGSGAYTGIGYTVSLSGVGDYLYYIRSDSYINRTGSIYPTGTGVYSWTNNTVARSYGEVEKVTTTLFNKPIVREPLVIFEQSDVAIVLVDSYTTLSTSGGFYLTYLAKPKFLGLTDTSTTTTTCELAWQTHEEIVKLAVDIYVKEYKYILSKKDNN